MRWIVRLLVFAAALFFGIGATAVGLEVRPYMTLRDIEVEELNPVRAGIAPDPEGIHVMYAGTVQITNKEQYLKFIIHNGGDEPLNYTGYSADHSFPLIRANESDLPDTYRCSRGTSRYTILPNRSVELHVSLDEFRSRPPKNSSISVGFNLRPVSAPEHSIHYSEPFPLPESFRRAISPQ
ncbi:MAG: hypothetical protein HOP17_02105 [Acidobacteria bacterium]|nr:hypothetical protein [Acidobacteriota bacterium]